MANNIGKMTVSIGADTADLMRGISRAKAGLNSVAKVARIGALAAAAAFTAGVAGLSAMTRQGLAFVDSQAKTARTVDGTIDGLRALQIVASDNAVPMDALNTSAQILGVRLAEAARLGAGPAADALKAMGLEARDLLALDVDQRFAAIADKAKEMGLSAQATGDLLKQFGIRNKELSLVMIQGGDAIRAARGEVLGFGLSLSGEAVAGIERANDAMSRIGFVAESLRNQLAINLAPVLEGMAGTFKDMAQLGGPLNLAVLAVSDAFGDLVRVLADPAFIEAATVIGVNILEAIGSVSRALVFLVENADLAAVAMVGLGAAMLFFSGPVGLAITAIAGGILLLSRNSDQAKTSAELAAEAEKTLTNQLGLLDSANADARISGRDLINSHIDQARAAIEAARAEYALARAESERAVAQARTQAQIPGNFAGPTDLQFALEDADNQALEFEALIAEREAQLARYSAVLEGFLTGAYPSHGSTADTSLLRSPGGAPGPEDVLGAVKLAEDLEALIASIDPAIAKAAKLAAGTEILNAALAAGSLTQEEYNLRLEQLTEVLADVPAGSVAAAAGLAAIKAEAEKAGAAGAEMAADLNGALTNLVNSIDKGMVSVKAFAVELIKMFAIRGISKLLGSSGWFDGPLFSAGSAALPGNANGTENWRGGLSWVGENGPEILDMRRGSKVIPNHKLDGFEGGGGAGGFVYAPTFNLPGATLEAVNSLKSQIQADAAQFEAKVVGAVRSAQNRRMLK